MKKRTQIFLGIFREIELFRSAIDLRRDLYSISRSSAAAAAVGKKIGLEGEARRPIPNLFLQILNFVKKNQKYGCDHM